MRTEGKEFQEDVKEYLHKNGYFTTLSAARDSSIKYINNNIYHVSNFEEITINPILSKYFSEYCERTAAAPVFKCYNSILHFEKVSDIKSLYSDARFINIKFFAHNSLMKLSFVPIHDRNEIQDKIKANNVDINMFSVSKVHIYNKLKNEIFPNFIESGLYNVRLVEKNNPHYSLMPSTKKLGIPRASSFLSVNHDTLLDVGKMLDDIKKLQEERDELREVNEHLNTYIDELYAEFVTPKSPLLQDINLNEKQKEKLKDEN